MAKYEPYTRKEYPSEEIPGQLSSFSMFRLLTSSRPPPLRSIRYNAGFASLSASM